MAAANASARGQRAAILASPLHELTGFQLTVDCLALAATASAASRRGGAGELLRPGLHGGTGAAPHAVLWRLWRACGRGPGWSPGRSSTRVRSRRVPLL